MKAGRRTKDRQANRVEKRNIKNIKIKKEAEKKRGA